MDPLAIIHFIIYPNFSGGLLIFKTVVLFFSFFFLAGIIYFLFKTSWLKRIILQDLYEILTYKSYETRKLEKSWQKIVKRLEAGLESEYKLAVIEAEEILNQALKGIGLKGESAGERINQLTTTLVSNLDALKDAHKIRSNIVHDPNYRLSLEEARKILEIYKKSLGDLEVI